MHPLYVRGLQAVGQVVALCLQDSPSSVAQLIAPVSNHVTTTTPQPITSKPSVPAFKPGCTAADETLVVHGHLEGLGKGLGGFGVLRTSAERLQNAAQAARVAGDIEAASQIEALEKRLPEIRTPEQAQALAQEMEPLITRTWNLGKKCKALPTPEPSPAMRQKAESLALLVSQGKMTKDQAIQELRKELKETEVAP